MTDTAPPERPTLEDCVRRLNDFTKAVTGDGPRDWHEFYLGIPARPHHDSDFIFTESVRLLESQAERIKELEAELQTAKDEAASWHEQWEGMCSERNWFAEEADALRQPHDAYKAATTILYGAIQDLKELGATVVICGIEPDVMQELAEARNSTPRANPFAKHYCERRGETLFGVRCTDCDCDPTTQETEE